jgi:AraC-like DNA-binding protein
LTAPDRHAPVQDQLRAWSNDGLQDYGGVQRQLPVIEESITQLDAGPFSAQAAVVSAGDLVLYRARPDVRSVGVTVLDPTYVGFAIPISWEGEYIINGRAAMASSMYLPAAGGVVYIRGGRRDTLGVIARRRKLIETIAALRGVNPDEVVLDDSPHELHPLGAGSLRRRLLAMLDAHCGGGSSTASAGGSERFAEDAFGLVADAYLYARPGERSKSGGVERLAPIVRRAEERFVEANAEPISLADLCAAAGVGKWKLYHAFWQMCDLPPLEYFRRRRLLRARSILMSAAAPARGGVKRAALSAGLTELGRFSVEYRQLFGESPSTTLGKLIV